MCLTGNMNIKPPYHITSLLPEMDLKNKTVLLRADLNVPLENGSILNDFRLKALLPTLELLLYKKEANVLLITHIGRPKKKEPNLSTRHLLSWFNEHHYDVIFAESIEEAKNLLKSNSFVLLENTRFWPEEKTGNQNFSQKLKNISEYYVMDAFGVTHRNDTSVTILPSLYQSENRTIGLLVEKELKELNKLIETPRQPFLMFLGGAKVKTKLPLLSNMLDKITSCALLPPLSFTFQKAEDVSTGTSLVDETLIPEAKAILKKAQTLDKKITVPCDYLVAPTWEGETHTITYDSFSEYDMGITIGPKTIALFSEAAHCAHTIFINGLPGDMRYPHTLIAAHDLCLAICNSSFTYKVAAGGDTVSMIQEFKLDGCFDFISTGGGATLTYLSGKELPGLLPFL
jgi:phosphoglycerate kinase